MGFHIAILLFLMTLLSRSTKLYILFAKLLLVQLCIRSLYRMEDWIAKARLSHRIALWTWLLYLMMSMI
jgi:hypothetical protein